MSNKISDYSMLEILQAANVETARTGNSTVCKCPVCKGAGDFKRGEHNAQINPETLFCYSENKSYSRTEIINELDLYETLDIKRWEDNYKPSIAQIKPAMAVVEKPTPEPVKAIAGPKKIVKTTVFSYCDLDGKVLYHRTRTDYTDKTKKIPYDDKPAEQPTVFYGLETLQDQQSLNFIMFAEGAKCAAALSAGIADTMAVENTAILGFDSPSEFEHIGKEAQDIILSKKIVIFQDNDLAGAKKVEGLLKYLNKTATVIDFADKPPKYDIADWLEQGGSVREAMEKYGKKVEPVPVPVPEQR